MRTATCHPERNHYGHGLCRPCWAATRYPEHKEVLKAQSRASYAAHRETRRAAQDAYRVIHRTEIESHKAAQCQTAKLEIMTHYCGGAPFCQWPGGCEYNVTNLEHLSIDHINGGGAAHRREIGRGSSRLYRWLKKNDFPRGFRILCYNHNCSDKRMP